MDLRRATYRVGTGLICESVSRRVLTYHGWSDVYDFRVGLVVHRYHRHFQLFYYAFLIHCRALNRISKLKSIQNLPIGDLRTYLVVIQFLGLQSIGVVRASRLFCGGELLAKIMTLAGRMG